MNTTTEIPLTISGRNFGAGSVTANDLLQQPIPTEFQPLNDELTRESALLKLVTSVTKQQVFAAYGHDLEVLKKFAMQLNDFFEAVVRSSIHHQDKEDAELFTRLRGLPPRLTDLSLITLDVTLAEQDAQEILVDLRRQFLAAVEGMCRDFVAHLHLLAETQWIGLLERSDRDPSIGAITFITHADEMRVTDRQTSTSSTQTTTTTTMLIADYVVLHRHELADIAIVTVDQYRRHRYIPKRVSTFIELTPAWLRPQLRVVDGTQIREQTRRLKTNESTVVLIETTPVYQYDPGIALGNLILTGWDEAEATQSQHNHALEKKRESVARVWTILIFVAACIGATIGATIAFNFAPPAERIAPTIGFGVFGFIIAGAVTLLFAASNDLLE
jgi:hypothetical protein